MMGKRGIMSAAALALVLALWSTATFTCAQGTAPEVSTPLAIVGGFLIDDFGGPPEALVRISGLSLMEVVVASEAGGAGARRQYRSYTLRTPGRHHSLGNPLDSTIYLQNVERIIKAGIVFEPAALRGSE